MNADYRAVGGECILVDCTHWHEMNECRDSIEFQKKRSLAVAHASEWRLSLMKILGCPIHVSSLLPSFNKGNCT